MTIQGTVQRYRTVVLAKELRDKLRRVVARDGVRITADALGTGPQTIHKAIELGILVRATAERIAAGIEGLP